MGANLTDAYDYVVAALEAAGITTVVTDARNVRPPCVLVEPPTITDNQSATFVELDFPITVMVPPPGNRDALVSLLATVDDVIGATTGPTTGGPSVVQVGNQELPAYQLTTRLQIRREP